MIDLTLVFSAKRSNIDADGTEGFESGLPAESKSKLPNRLNFRADYADCQFLVVATRRRPSPIHRIRSFVQMSRARRRVHRPAFQSSIRPSILVITARSDFADHDQRNGSEGI